jgi:hypothetical protein
VSSRLEGLADTELDLYRSVLRSFVAGRTPTAAELERRAAEDGLQLEEALGGFERRDLLWLNPERTAVAVAYPFSGTATPHEVALVQSRTLVFAMCAIDALGIPFLARQPALVRSRDPTTSESIEWESTPPASGDGAAWRCRDRGLLGGGAELDLRLSPCPLRRLA